MTIVVIDQRLEPNPLLRSRLRGSFPGTVKRDLLLGKPVDFQGTDRTTLLVWICRYSSRSSLRFHLETLLTTGRLEVDEFLAYDGKITRDHDKIKSYRRAVLSYLTKMLLFLAADPRRELGFIDTFYLADQHDSHGKILREIYRIGCRRRSRVIVDLLGHYVRPRFREKILGRTQWVEKSS